ncbi:MAG: hypothetical protein JW917_10865 [Ignavibacteria bacterium]|nr:hypothetical protein [Ignavibacteria bacterium]
MDNSIKEQNIADETNEKSELENGGSRIIEYYDDNITSDSDLSSVLRLLYELKKIDKELAEIEEEKGDLPERIEELDEKIEELEERISEDKSNLDIMRAEEKKIIKDNKTIEDKANKLDEQKYNVRNNREYDEISKMIDECFEILDRNESRLKEIETLTDDLENDIETNEDKLNEYEEKRDESQEQLDELNEQFKEEESGLNSERKKLISKLDYETKTLYERINSSYKGEALGIVRKGNCSGCYNSVPPQRAIEIRMSQKMYTCQSCGRILIDESLIKDL